MTSGSILLLIFDKINKLKNYSFVLKMRPGEATYVQRNSVMWFVTVLQLKLNNEFLLYFWSTRYCKPYNNTKYSTTMLLWQICVANNNKRYVDLHVNCPMLHWNKRIFLCSRRSWDVVYLHIVMTDKSLSRFSVFVSFAV